jgi:2-polyprenyl-3-methyl-5-hydroxy-6-metoxy-1,4-benzoquinol methylase
MDPADYAYPDFVKAPDPSHRPMYLFEILNLLRRDPSIRMVIDVGCGGGDFAEALANAGYAVCGVDLSESAVSAANARGVGRFAVSSVYDNLTEPFGVGSFDGAVCIETIEHLYSPGRMLRRVREALRPGGVFIVTTPYWGYAKNILLAVTNRMDRALTATWEGGHIKHFSRRTLTELLTREGFELIDFKGCGIGLRGIPFLWSGMLMAFRKPYGTLGPV